MPEKFPYNLEKAQKEAAKMQTKIESGEANDYAEAEKLIEKMENEKQEITESNKKRFIEYVSNGDFFNGRRYRYSLPEEIITSPEIQQAIKQGFIHQLSAGDVGRAFEIKNECLLTEEFIASPEVQQAAKQGIISRLTKGEFFALWAFEDKFPLLKDYSSSPEAQQAIRLGFICQLSLGHIDDALGTVDKYSLPKEIILYPEAQHAIERGFIRQLLNKDFSIAFDIKDKFPLLIKDVISSSEEARQAIKQMITECLPKNLDNILKIKNNLDLSEDIMQLAIEEGLINYFSCTDSNNIDTDIVLKIVDKLNISLSEDSVYRIAKQTFFNSLFKTDIDGAINIKNTFSLNVEAHEIIEKIPELNKILNEFKNISPEFYDQALKSVDIVISLIKFKDNPEQFLQEIKENPFLFDAISENPRFASKLLLKYPQLDDPSQQNIQHLFNTKKEILSNNPEIDPESLEFRQLMQDKLKEYGDNPKILKAIGKFGINIDEWLNYSETKYFNLESGDSHLAFSETISAPINRIKETLNSYAHTLKEVLRQYRPELSEFKIPLEDAKEIEQKIAQMQVELERAKEEGNEKKAQGIEKGIEALKKKIENIKTVALWDKLLGDISAFQQLKNDVFQAQENLIKAENDLQEKLSGKMPSGRIVQELKEKISKSKEELRGKFGVLEKRIDYFKDHLWTTISPCLGDDRTSALIQEINTNLAEQFDHYDQDRSTLSNLFSEKTDKEKSKMENQPMSIFVWARNPDIDLYQGNYSPCCIRIDSEHMGAESTIADYNTDLGIQIVNIWDETKSEPVTAAWCWIGENAEGETALVVDNIESNTQYSANYSEQLSKALFDYLKEYAKSIGVKKIVLGKANNDLPTSSELAKMKDDASKYEKVGGYNRPDGYFLEAEGKAVKLLWENLEPIEKVMQKVEKVAKVEFKNLNIEKLSEKDFERIKELEKKIYRDTGLALGQAMIEDMKSGNGLEYSIIASGKRPEGERIEAVGYLVALEDETDEGDPCIYLEDIALLPEAQGQQIGWEMLKNLIAKLKEKAKKENEPILLDMHLRETSQRFFERYHNELEQMGVKLLEEALVPDYYDEGEDSLYKVYQIKSD